MDEKSDADKKREDNSIFNQLPWPQQGDKLLSDDRAPGVVADINFTNSEMSFVEEGYRRAAEVLTEFCSSADGYAYRNFLIYPVVFLYRHYLELSLKAIIYDCYSELNNEPPTLNTHNLIELWKVVRSIFEQLPQTKKEETEAINIVEECIKELDKVDYKGESFRYYRNLKGDVNLPQQFSINITNFGKVMERVASVLVGGSEVMYQHLSFKHEMKLMAIEELGLDKEVEE